jgi:hypothetical protein
MPIEKNLSRREEMMESKGSRALHANTSECADLCFII